MTTLKSQWAARVSIAAAGLGYILPTVAPHIFSSANAAVPAKTQTVASNEILSPRQAARQNQIDSFCARVVGLSHQPVR